MSGKEDQFPAMTPLEHAFASIAPRVTGFDREQLLFLAGQASVQRGARPVARWAWPTAFSLMTAVAASLLVALCARPDARLAIRAAPDRPGTPNATVGEPAPAPTRPAAAEPPLVAWLPQWMPTSRYSQLRDGLLRSGAAGDRPTVTAPYEPLAAAAPSPTYRQLLDRLLESPASQTPKRMPPTLD